MLEEGLEKLKKILEKLESGKLGLDESIALFEEGAGIAKKSLQELERSKGKLKTIKKEIDSFVEVDQSNNE